MGNASIAMIATQAWSRVRPSSMVDCGVPESESFELDVFSIG
jgi:hypothetical protein